MQTQRPRTRCAVCGQNIVWKQAANKPHRTWRHERPQPSGAPHDHKPVPIGRLLRTVTNTHREDQR